MAAANRIIISYLTWYHLVSELQKRGNGRRESGAFLLGKTGSSKRNIETFICYDDLDSDALSNETILFRGHGYSALWDICAKKNLQVLADVHTHPSADVRQSIIDKKNPMVPVSGHIALIMPKFGCTSKFSLTGMGIHVFEGANRWKSYSYNAPNSPVCLKLW